MKKILFVCSGNTCRSPLAEGIAKKLFPASLQQEITVSSAGCSAIDGLPASPQAIAVAEKYAIDLSGHKSALLSRTLVKEADLIITMTAKHKETVAVIEPDALDYTYVLTEFSKNEEGDIPDPIGSGREGYEDTFSLIEDCLIGLQEKIKDFDGWKKQRS